MSDLPEILDTAGLARALQISPATCQRWLREAPETAPPHLIIGKSKRWHRETVQKWLKGELNDK